MKNSTKMRNWNNLLNSYWAKSDGTTIKEHTDRLLENLKVLKTYYGGDIERLLPLEFREKFWHLLEVACRYHDYGKLHCKFQQKVGNKNVKCPKTVKKEVKHNLLSPAFLLIQEGDSLKWEELLLVALAVFNHHKVEKLLDLEATFKVLREEFNIPEGEVEELYDCLHLKETTALRECFKNSKGIEKLYILLKGILLRLDHAGSVKNVSLYVEKSPISTLEVIEKRFQTEGKKLNDLQEFVKKHRDKNLLVVASTGYGKTEAGAIFLNRKGFFTLPIRTATNAIYQRFVNYFGREKVGLLHSSATSYLLNLHVVEGELTTNKGEGIVKTLFEAKHFAQPLVVCTPDQILPFVFHYAGYEKVLSTFSYARLVLDEIQAYEPNTLAFIVQALKEIAAFGGKFLITTATLPAFLREELKDTVELERSFFKEQERHRIKLEQRGIFQAMEQILSSSQKGKVLIIVNTVERAKKLYNLLKEKVNYVNLLHSRFIRKQRQQKEKDIEIFFRKGEKGIWITTQLAEASLDLDADYLFTELSTADSLVQRMGRVNRFGKKAVDEPNVFIFTEKPSGVGSVYTKDLLDITKSYLYAIGEGIWDEEKKAHFVELVYSKDTLKGTKYFETYRSAKNYIQSLRNLGLEESKREAVEKFRQIMDITVIPELFMGEVSELINNYKSATSYIEKLQIREQIFDYTLSVPYYWYMNFKSAFLSHPDLSKWGIFVLKVPYSEETGVGKPQGENQTFGNFL